MKTKIEIKSVFGKLLFEFECENNSISKTVNEAVKSSADLRSANLRSANLRSANLRSADLSFADLRSADLRSADLRSADLRSANLRSADLRSANLSFANLRSANLRSADLSFADLSFADFNEGTAFLNLSCPEEGSFVGFKKASDKIVKLLICEDAKRSSATTLKCRCSKAKVLEIQELDGSKSESLELKSNYESDFVYKVGEIVEVQDFDEDRWNECSTGIHFFMSREQAVKY